MSYILKSQIVNSAKFSYLRPIVESLLSSIAVDQGGYIQHPLTAQIGIDDEMTLSQIIASCILGVEQYVGTGETLALNPVILAWYKSKAIDVYTWKPLSV